MKAVNPAHKLAPAAVCTPQKNESSGICFFKHLGGYYTSWEGFWEEKQKFGKHQSRMFSRITAATELGEVTLETELALGSGSKEQEDFQNSFRFSSSLG